MTAAELKSGKILRGPIFPEPVQIIVSIPMGDAVKLVGNHGLESPTYAEQDGYFVVTFPGPDGNYDRIKTPKNAAGLITPAVEAQLNKRQRSMVTQLVRGEELTSGECQKRYKVSAQALHRDFQKLVSLGIAKAVGSGRSARYLLNPRE